MLLLSQVQDPTVVLPLGLTLSRLFQWQSWHLASLEIHEEN